MDEVTLFGAALIGAGIAVLVLALVRAFLRAGRTRARSRESRSRPAPPRPALAHAGSGAAAPPRVRSAPEAAVRRPRPPQAAVRPFAPQRPPAVLEPALKGETLQFGPVPAWALPVRPRNDPPRLRGSLPRRESSAARPGSAQQPGPAAPHAEERPPPERTDPVPEVAEAPGPDLEAARPAVMQFGWFTRGR